MSKQLIASDEICNFHIKLEKQAKRCRKYGICNNQDASGHSTNINESRYDNLFTIKKSIPVQPSYSYNLDFSIFPLLCYQIYHTLTEKSYKNVWEIMPFCSFMHAMTTCLNAWLFNTVTSINHENRYNDEEDAMLLIQDNMLVPQPIAEYFSMINTMTTPSGETIYVNLPDCCLPQLSIPAIGDIPRMSPGSFGSITPDSHNAYECYVSPYITRRLVEASCDGNIRYEPLPTGHYPQNAIPNMNLLGYFHFEGLTDDERLKVNNYHFPEEDDMTGRLQLVPRLMDDVNNTLQSFHSYYKMVPYHNIQRKSVQYNLIYNRYNEDPNIETIISDVMDMLCSPYSFDETAATKAAMFAFRRERTDQARGICYTADGDIEPNGWAATINDNFTMTGMFAPLIGIDYPQLRHAIHTAEMLTSRLDIIDSLFQASTQFM
ncbi:uncharacterized protein LOC116852861 [Odontomachus brunneus]|uniref:uncharacterized protein LOC116852861 n=1 Tax=Odontomachus brunneus TaxID=486640 RepID=UPI0013F1EBDF|nr:uncharacterized protein LOC116852861 [Odontomachus brunneus]